MTHAVYSLDSSALLAIDLLRRDPNGLACQLAARAIRLTASDSWPLVPPVRPDAVPGLAEARNNALAKGGDSTLDQLSATVAAEASRDTLASLVIGTAADAHAALLSFAPADSTLQPALSLLADGVLGLWSRKLISRADFYCLLAPAREYLRTTPLQLDQVDFPPHTTDVRTLVRLVGRLNSADFHALEEAAVDDQHWEGDMREATWAASFSGRQRAVALAQFTVMAVLGSSAHRHRIRMATLVMAATSLAGATQATVVADVVPAEIAERLLRNWNTMAKGRAAV